MAVLRLSSVWFVGVDGRFQVCLRKIGFTPLTRRILSLEEEKKGFVERILEENGKIRAAVAAIERTGPEPMSCRVAIDSCCCAVNTGGFSLKLGLYFKPNVVACSPL